jgi:hypothetical protein
MSDYRIASTDRTLAMTITFAFSGDKRAMLPSCGFGPPVASVGLDNAHYC